MVKKITILILLIIALKTVCSQTNISTCSLPESKQFDFWLGGWNLEWTNAKGETETGTNTINKILDGCVIQENFETSDGSFKGTSVSLYNQKLGKWQQTWVDNSGAYMDFTGGKNEYEQMVLSREANDKNGKAIMLKMIFYNITKDEFYWNWERSDDNGTNWKVLWKIHYKRKA